VPVVADVAAGTGKLARQLVDAGARCVAVEPSTAMRIECRRAAPGVDVVGGWAEALPFADHSFDLVTVAQAFHWFSPRVALREFARVLRPGGTLALIWNERQETAPWISALSDLMRRAGPGPHDPAEQLRPTFDGDPHFAPFVRWTGANDVEMGVADVVDMVGSRSYVRVLTPDQRAELLARVRHLVTTLRPPIVLPYVTSAYCAEALPTPAEENRWSD
jgi:SAM-dependent methyltransferase